MACLDLPVFPVQLLLRRHPEWTNLSVAVVDTDKPQGTILWINERARSFRILPGMRYAAALCLDGNMRAGTLPMKELESEVSSLSNRLRSFSPKVEPATEEPGVFRLDASGLERLYGSYKKWAGRIRSDLNRAGFRATVVVGFHRFGIYALAKARQGIIVFKDPDEERMAARDVPLDRIAIEPKPMAMLFKLGIKTVGQFIDLPPEGIDRRFGQEVGRLHQLASGELCLPFQPDRPPSPEVRCQTLDHPEIDVSRLLLVIERLLHSLLQTLEKRAHLLTEVQVRFRFDRMGEHVESIRPAEPTLDARQLLDLFRLRLQVARKLPDGVIEVVLRGLSDKTRAKQTGLFAVAPKRDLSAANRALARVRAELGDGAVMSARLREGHLPEGRFTWEPLATLKTPEPRNLDEVRLIRRIYGKPIPLKTPPRKGREGSMANMLGPYTVSGGWWRRPVHRDYYFVETREGNLFWAYHDRSRRQWFIQGRVE